MSTSSHKQPHRLYFSIRLVIYAVVPRLRARDTQSIRPSRNDTRNTHFPRGVGIFCREAGDRAALERKDTIGLVVFLGYECNV
jgi:hypothetical protein